MDGQGPLLCSIPNQTLFHRLSCPVGVAAPPCCRDLEGALQGAPQLATLHLPALALDPNRWCAGLRRLLDAFPTLSCIELPFSMCHELTQARRAFPGVQLR